MYENFVAQELNSYKLKPYYFSSKKQGEIDFVIDYELSNMLIESKVRKKLCKTFYIK